MARNDLKFNAGQIAAWSRPRPVENAAFVLWKASMSKGLQLWQTSFHHGPARSCPRRFNTCTCIAHRPRQRQSDL